MVCLVSCNLDFSNKTKTDDDKDFEFFILKLNCSYDNFLTFVDTVKTGAIFLAILKQIINPLIFKLLKI